MLQRALRGVVLSCGVMLMLASPACALTFEAAAFECGGNRGSGEADDAGNLYVPCTREGGVAKPHVRIYDAGGVRVGTVALPANPTDVAPAPNGAAVYVNSNTSKAVTKYTKVGGVWSRDDAWRLAAFPRWGATYQPLGEFITTDAQGYLYVSSGTWTNAPTGVIKYRPDGSFVTLFGDWLNSWDAGIFYWMIAGLVVTDDGASVYVAEVGNNRVQRFERQLDGTYAGARVVVGNDPNLDPDPRAGWCGDDVRPGRLAAPYDVGLDGAGNLYVLNTTCLQLKVFTAAGAILGTHTVRNPNGGYVHGMSVDRRGRVYLPEVGTILYPPGTKPAAQPQPTPPPPAQPAPITATYKGYATVKPAGGAATAQVWLWTAQGWQSQWWPAGRRAWVQPWTDGWMWSWYGGAWYAARYTLFVV